MLAVLGVLGSASLMAQSKIGYIDSEKILSTFPPAMDAQKKLEDENVKWGQEMQRMNDELRGLQEQLDQQSLLLSDAKKREMTDEMQAQVRRIQQFQDQKWGQQGEYFRRQQELLNPVYEQINAAIHKIGKEEGYDFIFDSVQGNLLFAQEKYDLTDKVLEELEKGTPTETKR
jgi:outer membrane protein